MKLDELPRLEIEGSRIVEGVFSVEGVFTYRVRTRHSGELPSVGKGAFLTSPTTWVRGTITSLDPNTLRAEVEIAGDDSNKEVEVGTLLPWIESPWTPEFVSRILIGPSAWQRTAFNPSPAVVSRGGGLEIWRRAAPGEVSSDDAIKVVPGAWDHEHCRICWGKIRQTEGTDGFGYFAEGNWLCDACFKQYVERQDLKFLMYM